MYHVQPLPYYHYFFIFSIKFPTFFLEIGIKFICTILVNNTTNEKFNKKNHFYEDLSSLNLSAFQILLFFQSKLHEINKSRSNPHVP